MLKIGYKMGVKLFLAAAAILQKWAGDGWESDLQAGKGDRGYNLRPPHPNRAEKSCKLPSHNTMHLMAKAAVGVYEAGVADDQQQHPLRG